MSTENSALPVVSSSPERNSFQKEGYIQRCIENSEEPSQAYLKMFEDIQAQDAEWAKQEHKDNLEYDLRSTQWILDKARASESYAQNVYAAMCNMRWQRIGTWPALTDSYWSCSWRSSGGIVADMLQKGDYIDWYCSGMGGLNASYDPDSGETFEQWQARTKFVPEGHVTDEIREDFQKLGWIPSPWPED